MRIAPLFMGLGLIAAVAVVPATAQRSQDKAKADPNRLICRSTVKTGTLAGRERQCFTRAQWDEIASHAQRRGFELQEGLRGKPCGDPSGGGC